MADMEVNDATAGFSPLNHTRHAPFFTFNAFVSFVTALPLRELIRLICIVGGYILLRPYLELGLRKLFSTEEGANTSAAAAPAPPPVEKSATDPAKAVGTSSTGSKVGSAVWGDAARKRQELMRQAWEEEQARLAEERDLEGIDPDLLED